MQSSRFNVSPPGAMLIGAILMCVAAAASLLIVTRAKDGDVVIISDPSSFEIVVEIRGAVHSPGVYRLPDDARLNDLLTAAGGVSDGADLTSHNLARRLVDAEIVVIGRLGTATPIVAVQSDEPDNPQSIAFRVNINTASQAELESLPGIGPVIAQRIIDYRVTNGPYVMIADLARVEGVSDRLLADIENLITAGP
jgi:competence protein ComEA